MKRLAAFADDFVRKLLAMEISYLYYQNNDGIVRWDVETGQRILIFVFEENGVSEALEKMLITREGQMPLLRLYGTVNHVKRDWIVRLSGEKIAREEDVEIVSLGITSGRVSQAVAEAAMEYPENGFQHTAVSGRREEERTKLFADIVAGKGPDILLVSREDMDMLYEKGALADLNTLLKAETLDTVLPGVVQMGSRDGELAGLVTEIRAYGMCIGDKEWPRDTWTLEEVVDLLEQGII